MTSRPAAADAKYTGRGWVPPPEAPDAHWVRPAQPMGVAIEPHMLPGFVDLGAPLRRLVGVMNEVEVALLLGVTVRTLGIWRGNDQGPDYAKCGQAVFYFPTDISLWAARQLVQVKHHG